MTDGPSILAELQARGLADPELEYNEVIGELAEGKPAVFVLSRRRERGIDGLVALSVDDHDLIEQLVALARAPWIAMEPPPEPAIPWSRIARDLRRTAGRDLALTLRWEQYPTGGYWMCDVSLDGSARGGMSLNWDDDAREAGLAQLADRLCESFLHEEIWGGWPICPHHRGRPMWATVAEDGVAVWACEADPARERVPIGDLDA